jgi:hypothetical protein
LRAWRRKGWVIEAVPFGIDARVSGGNNREMNWTFLRAEDPADRGRTGRWRDGR